MSEINGKTLSISFRIDEGMTEHSNRIVTANNVDGERVQDNIRASACCRRHILHGPYTRNAVRRSSLSSLRLCLSERVYFCFRAFPIPRESHRL